MRAGEHVRKYLTLETAHVIRNWSTRQYSAVNDLVASVRWCMTGTPIHNTVEDLGSLIKFLRVPSLSDPINFRRYISGARKEDRRISLPNVDNLKLLLGSMCLRRPNSILLLPGETEYVQELSFSAAEELAYGGLVKACKQSIAAATSGHDDKQAYRTVLSGVLRQRMFCNIGLEACQSDSVAGGDGMSEPEQIISILQQGGGATCVRCHADVLALDEPDSGESARPRLSHCYQLVCGDCVVELPKHAKGGKCPACKKTCKDAIFLERLPAAGNKTQALMSTSQGATSIIWPTKVQAIVTNLEQFLGTDKR